MSAEPDVMFTVIKAATHINPRLARLSLPGRTTIDTPHYLANTSRGVVPHLTQDTVLRSTSISGVYTSLEDFVERAPETPPIYEYCSSSSHSLRQFLATPESQLLVLGTRRTPPVIPPAASSNTNTSIAISTSKGLRSFGISEYAENVDNLGADILVGLADIPIGRSLNAKRITKATDRSIDWVRQYLANRRQSASKYFASLLPVTCAKQQYYIESLVNDHIDSIDGLVISSLDTLVDLPEPLEKLPRIGLTEASTPLQALHHIQCGLDMLVLPFIDVATDAGLALSFQFPGSDIAAEQLPLGIDMWTTAHATDLSPLLEACTCYACTNHHRAYVQHLLSAKEMLGWVLIQIHNHHVMSQFFGAVRQSISSGTFSTDLNTFGRSYESNLPEKTGQGPRVRGYQRRSEGPSEPRQNPVAFTAYKDDQTRRQINDVAKIHDKTGMQTVDVAETSDQTSKDINTSGIPDDFDIGLLDRPAG